MRSSRLLSILLLLQTRGKVPASEFAERLEVSRRTIYRDVEALSAAGVPVYSERGRGGGIALLPGYRTDVTGMTDDETRALFVLIARDSHQALGLGFALESALQKLMAAIPESRQEGARQMSRRILIDPAGWMQAPTEPPDMLPIQDAVFSDRRLRIGYRHSGQSRQSSSRAAPRTVDPYGLVSKAGTWYLVADSDGDPRLFRVDRITSLRTTDAPVQRRPGMELREVWGGLRDAVETISPTTRVHVQVRRTHLDLFRRIIGARIMRLGGHDCGDDKSDSFDAPDDNTEWVDATVGYSDPRGARQLLQFAANLRVISPPEARQSLRVLAGEVERLYEDETGD